ncbi:MAG TPA: TonB-dependent receptor [Nitrospiraceae bacterium]|jgi:vitamin B12 transporter|nr:TonB-dependent receptor [Nitrospiraceae bacterium]
MSFLCVWKRVLVAGVLLALALLSEGAPADAAQDHMELAQAEAEPTVKTEPVVISATKTPVPVSHVTSAVEVITEEDLQKQKLRTVVDALRLAQGLAVFSSGGPGTNATARIRGGSSAQTLVLIDGAIVNSPTLGEYNLANLTVDNIERIEILRGAQSMLWGSDAMGGVINIITKKGSGTPAVGGFFEYGSFGSIREGGQVSGKKGPVDFSMTLSRWDFTGFSAVNYRRGAAERDAYRNWQVSSRVGIDLPTDGRVDLTFRWMNGDIHLDNISTPSDVFGSRMRSHEFIFSGSYDQPLTAWWSQKITLARAQDASLFLPGTLQRNVVTGALSVPFGTPNETRVLSNRIEVQENFKIGEPLLLTAGYQLRDQQGENDTGLANKIIASHAGFAQVQLELWERVFTTAGVRHDSYNVFGDATTYRVTGGYLLRETRTKVRGSYATGFRTPTLNQLFFPNFGNPNLGPEKSQSMDVGVDQDLLGKRLRLSGGFFWNRYRDLIVTTFDPVVCAPFSTFGFCPINIGDASTKGWEAGFVYVYESDRLFLKGLDLQGQYTNTLTRDLDTNRRLPRWPVDQWSVMVGYVPVAPLRVTLNGRYVGSRFNTTGDRQGMKAFDVWTLIATYDLSKRVQIFSRVENLFNEKYEEILNAGTPVRSVFAGIRVSYDVK